MYSAGVNAALADFFCVSLTKTKEYTCPNAVTHMQLLSTESMMPPSFCQLTFAQTYSHYLAGDITAKGLITFYFKIHKIQIQDIWNSARAEENVRMKTGLEKPIFYNALMEMYIQYQRIIKDAA